MENQPSPSRSAGFLVKRRHSSTQTPKQLDSCFVLPAQPPRRLALEIIEYPAPLPVDFYRVPVGGTPPVNKVLPHFRGQRGRKNGAGCGRGQSNGTGRLWLQS